MCEKHMMNNKEPNTLHKQSWENSFAEIHQRMKQFYTMPHEERPGFIELLNW